MGPFFLPPIELLVLSYFLSRSSPSPSLLFISVSFGKEGALAPFSFISFAAEDAEVSLFLPFSSPSRQRRKISTPSPSGKGFSSLFFLFEVRLSPSLFFFPSPTEPQSYVLFTIAQRTNPAPFFLGCPLFSSSPAVDEGQSSFFPFLFREREFFPFSIL